MKNKTSVHKKTDIPVIKERIQVLHVHKLFGLLRTDKKQIINTYGDDVVMETLNGWKFITEQNMYWLEIKNDN